MFLEFLLVRELVALPVSSYGLLIGFSLVYVALGVGLFAARRRSVVRLLRRTRETVTA